MNTTGNKDTANYFGLQVEIIIQMNHYSWIRFQGRELIVDTADLVFSGSLKQAA